MTQKFKFGDKRQFFGEKLGARRFRQPENACVNAT
jgi:hypothetical protein